MQQDRPGKPGRAKEYPVKTSLQFTYEQNFWLRRQAKGRPMAEVIRELVDRAMAAENEPVAA